MVYTNNPPCGAMRGFGAVQTCFAAEAQMDKLAETLGIDPVELRLLNALGARGHPSDRPADRGLAPTAEVIRAAAALVPPEPEPLPRDPIRLPGRGRQHDARRRDPPRVGFAVGFKNICFSEGFDDYCAARVRLLADGSAEIHCAAAEVGQGVSNVILQVARTELGIDDVRLAPPVDGDSRLSRLDLGLPADVHGVRRRPRRLPCRARRARGAAAAARSTSSASSGTRATTPLDPETGQVTGERAHVSLAVAAMRVVAEVDVDLGLTRVVWIGAAQEIGRAIDPQVGRGPDRGRYRAGPRARA